MKSIITLLITVFSLSAFSEEIPPQIYKIVPSLNALGADPLIIEAVNKQNAQHASLDSIKQLDKQWRATQGLSSEMKAMMNNKAALRLSEFEQTKSYFFELFLMDNQGANVAMTNKTSDYWQGDEAKWKESFKGGKGAVHIGDIEFDESAQDYLIQVSVPVMEGNKAIGAITIGINLDELEAQ